MRSCPIWHATFTGDSALTLHSLSMVISRMSPLRCQLQCAAVRSPLEKHILRQQHSLRDRDLSSAGCIHVFSPTPKHLLRGLHHSDNKWLLEVLVMTAPDHQRCKIGMQYAGLCYWPLLIGRPDMSHKAKISVLSCRTTQLSIHSGENRARTWSQYRWGGGGPKPRLHRRDLAGRPASCAVRCALTGWEWSSSSAAPAPGPPHPRTPVPAWCGPPCR